MSPVEAAGKMALFDNVDKRMEITMLVKQAKAQWSDDDLERVKDLQKFILNKEDSWVLDAAVVRFVADVLRSVSVETKVRLMRVLGVCALRLGFVNLLNQDRENRYVMKYCNNFETLTLNEQKGIALFLCNLFSHSQTRNWVLYFSQWPLAVVPDRKTLETLAENEEEVVNVEMTSNARILCKVARLCLESLNPTLQDYGSAITYNISMRDVRMMQRPSSLEEGIATEDVVHSSLVNANGNNVATLRAFDAIALELALSILMLLRRGQKGSTELVQWRCLNALLGFVPLIRTDLRHFNHKFDSDANDLMHQDMSERNSKLVLELIAQVNLPVTN